MGLLGILVAVAIVIILFVTVFNKNMSNDIDSTVERYTNPVEHAQEVLEKEMESEK